MSANRQLVAGYRFFVTFEASNGKFFETKVVSLFGVPNPRVEECRLAVYYRPKSLA